MVVDWAEIILKAINIRGVYGRQMFETWRKMQGLLDGGLNLEPLITHRFEYQNFQNGFDTMASGQSGKVILSWSS